MRYFRKFLKSYTNYIPLRMRVQFKLAEKNYIGDPVWLFRNAIGDSKVCFLEKQKNETFTV
jgi:hypothetical protein